MFRFFLLRTFCCTNLTRFSSNKTKTWKTISWNTKTTVSYHPDMGMHSTQSSGINSKLWKLWSCEFVVGFDRQREKHFNYGQIYVALSRARSLQGLHVIGQLQNKHVRASPKVHAEYHRLRQQADTVCSFSPVTHGKNVTICLLNTNPLQKHSVDFKHHPSLKKCVILALTETQLLPHHSDNTITEALHPYALHKRDQPTVKYSSLAICTKTTSICCKNNSFHLSMVWYAMHWSQTLTKN